MAGLRGIGGPMAGAGAEDERRSRRLADDAPVLMWTAAVDGARRWFNRGWMRWTGRAPAAEPPEGWLEAVHPEDRQRVTSSWQAAVASRQPFELQYRLRRRDGLYGWVLDRGAPRSTAEGEPGGYVGACTDVTPMKDLEAELRRFNDRLRRLQSLTASLSGAVNVEQVVDIVLKQAIAAVGASRGAAALLSDDGAGLEVIGAVGYPAAAVESLRRFDVGAPLPLATAVRSGRRCAYESTADLLAAHPGLDEHVSLEHDRAVAATPLRVDGKVVGAFGVTFEEPRPLGACDLDLLEAVAAQCAQAIERARLYEAEAEARSAAEEASCRLGFLAEASRTLAESLDVGQTMQRLAELAIPRLADWCVVHVVDERGDIRAVATAHADRAQVAEVQVAQERWPVRADATEGVAAAVRSGRIQRYPTVTEEALAAVAADDDHLATLRRLRLSSAVVVPLRQHSDVLGTLSLANGGSRRLRDEDELLAEALAGRAAQAIANARAYTARSAQARSLQASLLPAGLPEIPGLELAARYVAAGDGATVGGDFYDVVPVPGGGWLLAIGDVRGKGVEAAAVTGIARHTIRACTRHGDTPLQILGHLHGALLDADVGNAVGELDIPRFCTVCLVALRGDADAVDLAVAIAGHPLPLAVRAGGAVEAVGVPGSLLGVIDLDIREVPARLGPGDSLVCFTDGVIERRSAGRHFEDELPEVLTGLAGTDAAGMALAVERSAEGFSSAPVSDDMAIVVTKVTPPRP